MRERDNFWGFYCISHRATNGDDGKQLLDSSMIPQAQEYTIVGTNE